MEGCAIDNRARARHHNHMRLVAFLLFTFWAGSALADPRAGHCSSGKWGHVQCIRPDHFLEEARLGHRFFRAPDLAGKQVRS